MGSGGSETIQVGFNLRDKQGYYITLNNVQAAAFVLAHEIDHRAGKLRSDGNDPFGFLSVMNNGDVQKACFGDVTPSSADLFSKPLIWRWKFCFRIPGFTTHPLTCLSG